MKKYILPISIFSLFTSSLFAQEANSGSVKWSENSAWKSGAVPASGANIITAGSGTMLVDGDYTVGSITGNYGTNKYTFNIETGKTLTMSTFTSSFACADAVTDRSVNFTGGKVVYTGGSLEMATSVGGDHLGGDDCKYSVNISSDIEFTNTSGVNFKSIDKAYKNDHADGEIGRYADFTVRILGNATSAGNVTLSSEVKSGTRGPEEDPGPTYTPTIYIPLTLSIGQADGTVGSMDVTGSLTVKDNTKFEVHNGSTLTLSKGFSATSKVNSGVTVNKGGSLVTTYDGASDTGWTQSNVYKMDLNGTFTYDTKGKHNNQNFLVINEGGKVTVGNGGGFVVAETGSSTDAQAHIQLQKDATLEYLAGAVANDNVVRIKMYGTGSRVVINTADALATTALTFEGDNTSTYLDVNTSTSISQFHFWGAGQGENSLTINISFGKDATLALGDLFDGINRNLNIILTDFFDNGEGKASAFKVATTSGFYKAVMADDAGKSWVANSFFANGYTDFWFDSQGYLRATAVAVPEPSTYAVIFGVVALGLAVYRRRK